MTTITILAIIALSLIGLLHFYWGFSGTVGLDKALPSENGKPLINPGKIMTLTVGAALIGFAGIAYLLHFYDLHSTSYRDYVLGAGWILSGIFTLRGIGEFNAVGLFKKIKSSEFAHYDTRFYTPFSLSMGMVFAALAYRAS